MVYGIGAPAEFEMVRNEEAINQLNSRNDSDHPIERSLGSADTKANPSTSNSADLSMDSGSRFPVPTTQTSSTSRGTTDELLSFSQY